MQPQNVPALAAKIGLSLVSVLLIAVTGFAWAQMQGFVEGMTFADVLEGDTGPQPADGSRDILLVGLDSRTDAQGNPLPRKLLRKLRAGHDAGELNTDTLILLHIPNDGSKAVALSMPRDSYVELADDYGTHKINSAYGRAKIVKQRELTEGGTPQGKELEVQGNQAGAKMIISTVEKLTGRTIDNFASVNLLGFYEITKAVGGVEVCLNNDVEDIKSGAKFNAGRQTISGAQALSFVRQRQGLPRGDLDRVVRQQVFMAGLARKTISAGTLSDPDKLRGLQGALKRSVVLNKGWDIVDFAQQMSGLTGGQIQFRTIPVGDDIRTDDGWAIEVDPAKVQEFIGGLSGSTKPQQAAPADPANATTTVDVMNGTGITGLAADLLASLGGRGFTTGGTGDVAARDTTVVRHAPGDEAAAQRVADAVEGNPALEVDPALAPGKVTVLIGADYPSGAGANGGGSQPPGGDEQSEPPAEERKPITADGVTCVN